MLLFISKMGFSQFYIEGNMLASTNDFNVIKPTCNFITGAKLTPKENSIIVNLKIKGDTVSGYYLVYKSHDFNNIEFVDRIIIPKGLNPQINLLFSAEDTNPNYFYNFYHIVIVKENENFNPAFQYKSIKDMALVNLPYVSEVKSNKSINKPFSLIISNQ